MRGDDGGNLGDYAITGGPGRPRGSLNKATQHRALIAQAMTDDDELAIWLVLANQAKKGDIAAARLVMEYKYGKPKQVHEIDADIGLQHLNFAVAPLSHESDTTDDASSTVG